MNVVPVLKGEMKRTLQELKYYWIYTVTNVIVTIIFFLGLYSTLSASGSQLSASFFVVSILLWYYSLEMINQMSHYITEEKYFGTIEKLFVSPYGPLVILGCRAIASMAFSSAIVLCLYFPLSLLAHAPLAAVTPAMIFAVTITLLGIYGFGLALAGLTILSSRTSSVGYILTYIILFTSGMVTPLETLPPVIGYIARALPLALGVENLRIAESNSLGMWDLFRYPTFFYQICYSLLSIAIGFLLFKYSISKAKSRGVLHIA
ncbi:MAG: ABC transporter permease [Candidatus Bathyarchaeia archaeon]|nr:ABC transporter permease [Candidatus Bathyarchaeia archaeon]